MPAKACNFALVELLMQYGATVPVMTKWCRFYYFETFASAEYLITHGMDANHHSWREVSLLHDMAHEGSIEKAALLLDNGANINAIDEDYRSTPLGFAARWGRTAMAAFLIERGADIHKAGATSATPLEWSRRNKHADVEKLLLAKGAG